MTKQGAYLGCVLFSAEGTGDPAMEDLKDLYLLSLYAFVRVPEAQIPEDTVDEQFTPHFRQAPVLTSPA